MKYSIRGAIRTIDGEALIVATINNYTLWRLDTSSVDGTFTFEVWVNTSTDKTALFDDLKPFVNTWGGSIDWHECSHDEATPKPCAISETYNL